MLRFFNEKMVITISFYMTFFAILAIFGYINYKRVSFQPASGSAPFTETLTRNSANAILPEQRSLPLEKPHRTNKELQNWSSMSVSEALSFDKNNYQSVAKHVRPYFTDSGFKQYQEYLQSSGIMESVNKSDYRMSVFVDEKPLLMNDLALHDVYRWLYQLPITVSFIPRTALDLIGREDSINRRLTLNIQVRRVKLPEDPNAVQIESWKITSRR